jgi:hypothetical protein
MSEENKLKVEFAPGCFDHLDVDSQEELDAIMAELTDMFANMTSEEIEANSRQLTDEDIENMDAEDREALLEAMTQLNNKKRKNQLQ